MRHHKSFPFSHLLLILALGTVLYFNSFGVPFVLDDLTSIVRNPVIQDIANFVPGGSGYESNPRRWFGYLTFALNFHYGGLDVTGYHFFNLIVHLASALLVYAMVRLTFHTPHLSESRLAPHAGIIALLAALFFVAHPVQTQAVTYIVQRLTSLCTLFYLLSLVLYVAARLDIGARTLENKQKEKSGPWKAILLITGSVVSALLAMQTKEIAFTLPLAVLLYEFFFFHGEWKRRALFLLPLMLTLPVIPFSVLSTGGGDYLDDLSADVDSQLRAGTELPRLHYLFTQIRVLVTYLRLLAFPINQNLDYDYPVFTSIFAPPVFLSLLLLASLFTLAVFLYYRAANPSPSTPGRDPALGLVSFGIFWFFLTLCVESSLIPIEDVIFEHRLYLPSVGFSMVAAILIVLLSRISKELFAGRIPLIASALIILVLGVATWQRNQIWRDPITLWHDAALKSPGKSRPWYNLGTYYSEDGRLEESAKALHRAVQLNPQNADAWHNLGRTYLMAGFNAEAVTFLKKAVDLQPDLDNAFVNLAVAMIRDRRPGEAVHVLEKNLPRLAGVPEVRLNLGIAYAHIGNLAGAYGELAALRNLAPHLVPNLIGQIDIVKTDDQTQAR